jgi:hypothetical protein
MTTVEIVFSYSGQLSEQKALALARARDVYGIRGLKLDRTAGTIRIEYDASRLDLATVSKLVRQAGVEIVEPSAIGALAPAQEPSPAA